MRCSPSKNVTSGKMLEIVHSIVETVLGPAVTADGPLVGEDSEIGWQHLAVALRQELGVEVAAQRLQSTKSLLALSDLVQLQLPKDSKGRSIVDIYARVEQFVREELSHNIDYHWFATWKGDLLNDNDSLDDVEIVIRMENAFGFSIPDRDVAAMRTVAQTVRYLWRRSLEQDFVLRSLPTGTCPCAFVFFELRRLLIKRTGLARKDIHPSARLGDLMTDSMLFNFGADTNRIWHRPTAS